VGYLRALNLEPAQRVWQPRRQLLSILRGALNNPALLYAEPPRRLGGGFSNEIVRIRLLDGPPNFSGPLVVRAMHDDDDAMRESVIQHGVAQAGFGAPPVLMRGSSKSPLERPFTISPLVAGKTFDALLNPTTVLGTFRRLPAQLAETMSALHALPTEAIAERLAAAGWPASRLDSLAVLAEIETQAASLHTPALMAGAAWLANHRPNFAPAVVCHGDLHPLNLLFEGERVVAVLDWELARLADPAFDVARTLMLLRMSPAPTPHVPRAVVKRVSKRLGKSFVEEYRTHRGVDEASLQWHEALHCLRTATIATLGAQPSAPPRMRRTADVWLDAVPRLKKRFTDITSVPM
jgi:aminoglycoside phosphotransferase (APT) family kinase protein